ncbi:Uncharacterised protein [Mycobacterium tuberculosis]|nr:Uncharacterised protein [Mycobacterium tuberculosis]
MAALPACCRAWKLSTAIGTGVGLPCPNGPDSYIPGPPSTDNEHPISSVIAAAGSSPTYDVGMT